MILILVESLGSSLIDNLEKKDYTTILQNSSITFWLLQIII